VVKPVEELPRRSRSTWEPEFSHDVSCYLCGLKGRPVAGPKSSGEKRGICEACSIELYWTWHDMPRDKDPVTESLRPVRVKVLVPRLTSDGGQYPELVASYSIAMQKGDSDLDLPTAELRTEDAYKVAVLDALRPLGISTWPWCIERLYDAHSPTGDFVRVVMLTAWTTDKAKDEEGHSLVEWRPWPPWEHALGTAGLYLILRETFDLHLRLWRLRNAEAKSFSVELRQGAATYLRSQLSLRKGDDKIDSTMLAYARDSMSDEEKRTCEYVLKCYSDEEEAKKQEKARREKARREAENPPQENPFGALPEAGEQPTDAVAPELESSDEAGSLDDELGEEES